MSLRSETPQARTTTAQLRALTNLARAASAGPGEVEPLLGRMCASLAETFGFERFDAYRHLRDRGEVLMISGVGVAQPLAERPAFGRALESGQALVADGELVLPLPAADGVVGFLCAPCDSEPNGERFELLHACAALVAVSLQRALEHEELERLGRLQKNFIALASHELRAPAAVVHGSGSRPSRRSIVCASPGRAAAGRRPARRALPARLPGAARLAAGRATRSRRPARGCRARSGGP